MALFLGIKEGDLLQSRMAKDFIESCRAVLYEKLSTLDSQGHIDLLKMFSSRLDEELGSVEEIARQVETAAAALDQDGSDLAGAHATLNKAAVSHFARFGSVLSLQSMVSMYRDILIRRILFSAEKELAAAGAGGPADSYACLVAGSAGRMEATLTPEASLVIIHGEESRKKWFHQLGEVVTEKAGAAGLPLLPLLRRKPVFVASRTRWQGLINELLPQEEDEGGLQLLADARHVYGDLALSAELRRLACKGLDDAKLLAALGKKAALMPVAIGFLGRIKLERSGPHRGECNITRSAIAPLVATVRIMSLMHGISETNTAKRIKLLLEAGKLDVDLAERLLRAYYDFNRLKIQTEIEHGADSDGSFVAVEGLSQQDEERLRSGLETVVNLEKIIYSMVVA